jgi:hypothetical protein
MPSPSVLLLAALAAVGSAAAENGTPSASGDGGDPIAVPDSWLVRFEYDLGLSAGCFTNPPNFVEATQGCYTDEGPLADCSIQYGSTFNSTEDVQLVYYSSECTTDVTSAISKAYDDVDSLHIRLDHFLDDGCETLDYTTTYHPDRMCHVGARVDASGNWVGVSTIASFDAFNATASVLEYSTTDCSGDPEVETTIDTKMLQSDACVSKMKGSTNYPFADQSGGSNGGSIQNGFATARIVVVAAFIALHA